MFGNEFSSDEAMTLKREQAAVLKASATARKNAGVTLREQRVEEGRLLAAARAERDQTDQTGQLSTATVRQVPRSAPPADPDAALRTGIRGVLIVAVLVLVFLWVRQRRRGVK